MLFSILESLADVCPSSQTSGNLWERNSSFANSHTVIHITLSQSTNPASPERPRLWVNSRPPPAKPTGSGACQCANQQCWGLWFTLGSQYWLCLHSPLHLSYLHMHSNSMIHEQQQSSHNQLSILGNYTLLYVMICICVACLKKFSMLSAWTL